MSEFYTIKDSSEGIYKEKGSKFLAFAFPVDTEEAVKVHLDNLKRQYHDARHHCYAYMLGLREPDRRASDDGEPSHSAGDPILGQIRSRRLTNCLVVVVRYFGGTKLGVGGLIQAYRAAADAALENARVVAVYARARFELSFAYPSTAEVERILGNFEIEYMNKEYTDRCFFTGLVKDAECGILSAMMEPVKEASLRWKE